MSRSTKNSLVEVRIPKKPEFLRVVRLLVSGYASRWPISIDEVENIKVAVSEACNTAIQDSCEEECEEQIAIKCWHEGNQLVFEIKDKSHKGKSQDDIGELHEERGLGMLLIKTLMDEVDSKFGPNKGAKITMKKNLRSA